MLLGREQERRAIERALETARSGATATVVLAGEPGIGKTALLDHAAGQAAAAGMQVLRARGIEAEAQIPFASLLELLRPALGGLGEIPRPQAMAVEAAFAMRPGASHERFAVGAGTLSLLAAHAERGPVAVLVDDAHWVDAPSAQALVFALRRLIADPIAFVLAARADEPSLLDAAGLPVLHVGGIGRADAARLLPRLGPQQLDRLYEATAGNPFAMLELAAAAGELELAPGGAPLRAPPSVSRALMRRVEALPGPTRRALLLVATSGSGQLPELERAGARLGIDLGALDAAERAGLVTVAPASVEVAHPLIRSAIYGEAPASERRAMHRALAGVLPDRDADRRAWHLACATTGLDAAASAALEQAGRRACERAAYPSGAAALERAARLAPEDSDRARLLLEAARTRWTAGEGDRAITLLEEARAATRDPALAVAVDRLAGHIATRRGPIMEGYRILVAAAERAAPDAAVEMLAEAASACFYAGEPRRMIAVAQDAYDALRPTSPPRVRFVATMAFGMARVVRGDAAAGARAINDAVAVAERERALREDLELLPWVAVGPTFLRQAEPGRSLLEEALTTARERAAVGAMPALLNILARDQATTDAWAPAEASYREAIAMARESDQRTQLVFGLSGLAWLQARRGREDECRSLVAEARALCQEVGTRLHEVWTCAALADLELGLGRAGPAVAHLERQRDLLEELGITDVDLSPAPELVDALLRLGRTGEAEPVARTFLAGAEAKGRPWSLARALRTAAMVRADDDGVAAFEAALAQHAGSPDAFERARTYLAYGQRLRRMGRRVLARAQLYRAHDIFEHLDARPWAESAGVELAATGERVRPREPSGRDELTPQELQIGLLLAAGKTTREAAGALFLSPKTIEYHLRHVYIKLGIHSRAELAEELARYRR